MSQANRRSTASGLLFGALTADAAAESTHHGRWGPAGERLVLAAEELCAGHSAPIDLDPVAAVALGIFVGARDDAVPLLAEPTAIVVASTVADMVRGVTSLDAADTTDPVVAAAIDAARRADDFAALENGAGTTDESRRLLAASLHAGSHGPGSIRARATTKLSGPAGARTYHRGQIVRLAERLVGLDPLEMMPDPRRRLGPTETLPGLWLGNIHAVRPFLDRHDAGALISLCRTNGRFDAHEDRVEVFLSDSGSRADNPSLGAVVDDVIDEIERRRAAATPVLVHCRAGSSRTGLVLRAMVIDELRLDEPTASAEAQALWPATSRKNLHFTRWLAARAGSTR